jgi:hypothetical protein
LRGLRRSGFDRDGAFFPTVVVVVVSYYVLFEAMAGSVQLVLLESAVMTAFVIAAVWPATAARHSVPPTISEPQAASFG